jgi:hypothetical protein
LRRGRARWFAAAVLCGAGDSSAAARGMGCGRVLGRAERGQAAEAWDQAGQKRGRRRWVPAGSGAGDVVGVCRARRTAAMERFSFREDERRLRLRSAKKAGPETGRNRCGEAACTSPVACSRLILAALLIASPLQGVPPPVCMLRNSQAQALRARRTTRARLRCETAVRCALRRATMPMPLSRPNADRPPTSR